MASNTGQLIETLRPELDTIRQDLTDLRPHVAIDDTVGTFFLERLELTLESAIGCILLAKAELAFPVAILARSMLELTISTFWAASTPERGLEASGASTIELIRILGILTTKGHGKIVDKTTGEDKTARMLEEIQKDKKRPRKQIAQMARECGLGKVYEIFYSLQSMPSHGHRIGLSGGGPGDAGLYAMMTGVRANLKAVHFVIVKRIRQREATTLVELDQFLKVGLVLN